ncbi:MAG TPA: hypothetical protein VLE43_08275 [Candidatus Saccharimonadia bacterium]|nr:hypothetical protein [Candidatus Saccharimonadia bacterium]
MEKNDINEKLLTACRQAGPHFTMREVLEQLVGSGPLLVSEHPLLVSFSDAWVDLMQAQVIVLVNDDEPEKYQLARDRT